MCEVPRRSWRPLLNPKRLVLGFAGFALVVAGILWTVDSPDNDLSGLGGFALGLYSLGLIALGAALLVSGVVIPAVKEVEFGFPSGVRIRTALSTREEALREEFGRQRSDLELCAHLLCDDPEVAPQLLEQSWSAATTVWRGPVTADLRTFVLRHLVDFVAADSRWNPQEIRSSGEGTPLLFTLDAAERTAVVLHDFAGLSSGQIAALTERSIDQVRADLRGGTAKAEAESVQ